METQTWYLAGIRPYMPISQKYVFETFFTNISIAPLSFWYKFFNPDLPGGINLLVTHPNFAKFDDISKIDLQLILWIFKRNSNCF